MYKMNAILMAGAIVFSMMSGIASARTYHVSVSGKDANNGAPASPLQTISAAADLARPGDVITVHEGVYRERINPPRGGTSDDQRIVYQAAPGEKVVIKGSERITGWEKVGDDVWRVSLPNRFFGEFNPYSDVIRGDWYQARQAYHTGAVYQNGHWLKEAPRKSVVTGGDDAAGESKTELMNVEFLMLEDASTINAVDASSQSRDIAVVDLEDGRRCLGPVTDGDWLAFEGVDFGEKGRKLWLSTGSPVGGGLVEVRKDTADGELLGTLEAGLTAEWTYFQKFGVDLDQPVSGKQAIVLVFKTRPVAPPKASDLGYWFAEVDENTTTIWAQFKEINPNEELVEINVRQSVFYPEETGRDFITVKGFTLEQAATPWSPPTAEQIGLIGANWCKGWIIEDNTIRYSTCTGLTLGKHGDEFDNTGNYYRSIRVGLKNGWNKETIGSHLVRNNHILYCGQAGIVGSLGAAFSAIIGNEIHEIRQDHEYGGCETAGIKFHGAVDVIIANNHIYNCEHWSGLWLDWMSQGARVTGNLMHDNSNDVMFEMNHGPMLIDNNILLSEASVRDASGGGAYVHNLVTGRTQIWNNLARRKTPFFKPHSTEIIVDEAPNTRFGAEGGKVAGFKAPVGNTEQDPVYQTVRYNTKGYRLNVPNGTYTVTLKFNEPFHNAQGKRRFGAMVQGNSVADKLDLAETAGKNVAFDVTAENVRVENGELNIGLVRELGHPCIAGIEVAGTTGAYVQRINCGGDVWEDFKTDFVIKPQAPIVAYEDQPLIARVGTTVDQHDDRFFNNLYVKAGSLAAYDLHQFEIKADGNVFLAGGQPSKREQNPVVAATFDPGIKLVEKNDGWWLEMNVDPAWRINAKRSVVTSERLGKASLPDAQFEKPDGTPYKIDTDYFGKKRDANNPAPGPFRAALSGKVSVKVWSE
jgi:hypothetical protein